MIKTSILCRNNLNNTMYVKKSHYSKGKTILLCLFIAKRVDDPLD